MTLRVAVDATAVPARRVGAGVYTVELVRALDGLGLDLHVLVNRRDVDEMAGMAPCATLHPVALPNRAARLLWAHSALGARVRRIGPHLLHGPHYTLPARTGCAGVVTFHDPTFFTLPELHERAKVSYFTRAARSGIARASRVIAVSRYAARGAVEHAGADAARVDVVMHGVDPARYAPAEAEPFAFEPFVLFVGALEPRKQVPALIRAYSELGSGGIPHHLVVAGPPAWGAAEAETAARAAAGRVHLLSYVAEDEKIRLYRRASAFVYPSVAEGFGLPVLEAMACGTPVVTTSGSAPEEVAGGAALLVDPHDPGALRDALSRVLGDEALATDLRHRGIERARGFTWAVTAEATADVYERAVASSRG